MNVTIAMQAYRAAAVQLHDARRSRDQALSTLHDVMIPRLEAAEEAMANAEKGLYEAIIEDTVHVGSAVTR